MKRTTSDNVFEMLLKKDAPIVHSGLKGQVDIDKLSEDEKLHIYASGASNKFDENEKEEKVEFCNPKLIAEVMRKSAAQRQQYLPKKRLFRYHKTTIALAASILLILSVHMFMINTYVSNSISIMDHTNIETTAYGLSTRGEKGSIITHSRFQELLKEEVGSKFQLKSGRTNYKLVIRPNQQKDNEVILYLYNKDLHMVGSKSLILDQKNDTARQIKDAVSAFKREL